MAEVSCPNCSQRLSAPANAIGKSAKCAGCGHRFVIEASQVVPDAPRAPIAPAGPPGSFPTFERAASEIAGSEFWRRAAKVIAWVALVGGVIGMLNALDMKTTVEGVHNQGLMHERLVNVMVSGLAILSGLLLLCGLGLIATIRERLPLNR